MVTETRRGRLLLAGVAWAGVGVALLLPGDLLQQATSWLGWQSRPSPPCSGLMCLDKLVHLAIFGVLCWLTARIRPRSRRAQLLSLLAVATYGWLLEGLQGWLGWRETDLLDALCNTVGALLGLLFAVSRPWRRD